MKESTVALVSTLNQYAVEERAKAEAHAAAWREQEQRRQDDYRRIVRNTIRAMVQE